MATPTARDHENAATRRAIADKLQAEWDEAKALAEAGFGPGFEPAGRHMLVEKDDEEKARAGGERPTPAATVYTARRDGVKRHFVVEDGVPREVASMEDGFGEMLTAPHPDKGFHHKGQWCPYHRYSLHWAGYETYSPQTAEELAGARERREAKAVARMAEENPLFSEHVLAGTWGPGKKPRGRG